MTTFTLFFSKFITEQSLAITNAVYFYEHILQCCSILTKPVEQSKFQILHSHGTSIQGTNKREVRNKSRKRMNISTELL